MARALASLAVRRRLVALIGVLAIGVALSACSANPNSGGGGNNKQGSTGGKVTLTLFQCETCVPFPWQISDFEKAYPSIHINVEHVPFGQFYAKTAVLAQSSSPPDLYTVDQPTIANLAAGGVIMPLDKYLDPSYVQSMNPAAKADFSYAGKLYSPGPIDTALGLFYNKTMLDKVGVHPPSSIAHAWTWQQALDAFRRCQQGPSAHPKVWGLAPTTFGNGTPGFDYISVLFLRSQGNPKAGGTAAHTFQAISSDGKSVDGYINTPQAVAGATFYQHLFQGAGRVSPSTGIPNAFLDGKACFDMNTSNDIDTITAAKVNFKWGVTYWPHFQTPIVHNGSTEIAIGSKTKHLKQAVTFVKFVSSAAQQKQMISKTGYLPVIASLYKSMSVLQSPPWSIFSQELANWGQPRPVTPHYLQFSQIVTNAMRDIAYGSNPKSRLDQAASQLSPLLQQPAGSL